MLDNTKDCQNREFDIYEAACGGVLSSGRALTGSLAWPLPVYPGTGTRGQSSLPLDFPFFYRGCDGGGGGGGGPTPVPECPSALEPSCSALIPAAC